MEFRLSLFVTFYRFWLADLAVLRVSVRTLSHSFCSLVHVNVLGLSTNQNPITKILAFLGKCYDPIRWITGCRRTSSSKAEVFDRSNTYTCSSSYSRPRFSQSNVAIQPTQTQTFISVAGSLPFVYPLRDRYDCHRFG